MNPVSITLVKSFSAAHFYKNENWTPEKNKQMFGKCFTDYGHGHDYKIEVEVPFSQKQELEKALNVLLERLDHQHLNFVIPEFKTLIPTTENLALFCKCELLKNGSLELRNLRLYESSNLWVEIQ
jgi:6-pyruvoyltetrahydropterin/6-carboxytetrahydropterin synthase